MRPPRGKQWFGLLDRQWPLHVDLPAERSRPDTVEQQIQGLRRASPGPPLCRRQDLRGRADVRVTLDGWERAAHAGTKEDPDSPDGGLGSVVRPCRGASALREGQRGAATDGPGVQTISCHGGVAYPTLSH